MKTITVMTLAGNLAPGPASAAVAAAARPRQALGARGPAAGPKMGGWLTD